MCCFGQQWLSSMGRWLHYGDHYVHVPLCFGMFVAQPLNQTNQT